MAARRLAARLARFAADPHAPILLEGESGTGKTMLARCIHDMSPRARSPFRSVLLSAIDDSLCASELFGHVTGAYTDARRPRDGQFASANGGSILLDEIGKASLHVQARLLDVIEGREFRPVGSDRDMRVDVRVIVATNRSLEEQAEVGAFLPDLLARVKVFRIVIPPLRERRADIPQLCEHYVKLHSARREASRVPTLDRDLVEALRLAPWPNNLRELSATMHRLLIEADGGDVITLDHCRDELEYLRGALGATAALSSERIEMAIRNAGSIAGAARELRVDRTTIHRRLKRDGETSGPRIGVNVSEPVAPHVGVTS
jgi:DNA-binding NtrC family response regulator